MAFVDNEDGSVTDTLSGLKWKKAVTERLLWGEAAADAPEGWRIPTLDEVQSLIKNQKADEAGCTAAFGAENLPTDWLWVYKIDPAETLDWEDSEKTAEDAEALALEKPGHVAAYFVWMGFQPINRRLDRALCRYVEIASTLP